jgi:hypothetical protein
MSERTQTLENAASRALLDFVKDPTEAKANAADNVVWRIAEAVVAKVAENLTSEIEAVRRVACAEPTETMTNAVKRLARERDAIHKKYRKAQEAWEEERQKTEVVIEAAYEFADSLSDEHSCKRDGDECPRCRLVYALGDLEEEP